VALPYFCPVGFAASAAGMVWGLNALFHSWWWNEYLTNPVHVYIETFLLLLAVYIMVFKRQYNPEKKSVQ
jgi:hypothetical protein